MRAINIVYIPIYFLGFFILSCTVSVGALFGFTMFVLSLLIGYEIEISYISIIAFVFSFFVIYKANNSWIADKFLHLPIEFLGEFYKKIWCEHLDEKDLKTIEKNTFEFKYYMGKEE